MKKMSKMKTLIFKKKNMKRKNLIKQTRNMKMKKKMKRVVLPRKQRQSGTECKSSKREAEVKRGGVKQEMLSKM